MSKKGPKVSPVTKSGGEEGEEDGARGTSDAYCEADAADDVVATDAEDDLEVGVDDEAAVEAEDDAEDDDAEDDQEESAEEDRAESAELRTV